MFWIGQIASLWMMAWLRLYSLPGPDKNYRQSFFPPVGRVLEEVQERRVLQLS